MDFHLKYWLTPDGEVLAMEKETTHPQFIIDYLTPTLGKDRAYELATEEYHDDGKTELEQKGWRRLADYGRGLTVAGIDVPNMRLSEYQRKALSDLYLELGQERPDFLEDHI